MAHYVVSGQSLRTLRGNNFAMGRGSENEKRRVGFVNRVNRKKERWGNIYKCCDEKPFASCVINIRMDKVKRTLQKLFVSKVISEIFWRSLLTLSIHSYVTSPSLTSSNCDDQVANLGGGRLGNRRLLKFFCYLDWYNIYQIQC